MAGDWDTKVFDVFLSHKITDAKDIVLTWYNALSALGYHPFLDRLSLDAVENIPKYVEQTVTFAIAVTSNLWQSYWCAVELIKAVQLHMGGKLNILLIPIQGDRFKIPEGHMSAGLELDFPTPEIMMQNFGKWFGFNGMCPDEAVADIQRLYGGGEFTQCRLVKHTLMHYKSFERLFVARCGKSIKAHKMIEELVAAGGVPVAEQAERLAPLISEANAMRKQNGEQEFYEARVSHGSGALGYENKSDLTSQELVIAELLPGDADDDFDDFVEVACFSAQEFIELLRGLRAEHESFGTAATNISTVLEQWILLAETGSDQYVEMARMLKQALAPAKEFGKNILSFLQIGATFVVTFGGVEFPALFTSLAEMLGVFNFDFLSLELIQALIAAEVNYCGTSVGLGLQLSGFLASIPLAYRIIVALKRPTPAKRAEFFDHSIFLAVLVCFIIYPIITLRVMKLFKTRAFGEHILVEADWRIDAGGTDYMRCRIWGGAFMLLYVLGIPFFFFGLLWVYARPLNKQVDVAHQSAEKAMRAERTALRRFGILYAKYSPGCWWWELVELMRKMTLTGGLIFIRPGTVSQIWVSMMLAMLFMIAATFFTPYRDGRISFLSISCQFCTFLTLLCILALRTKLYEEGLLTTDILNIALIVLTILPLLLGIWLLYSAVSELVKARRRMRKNLPAAMKDEAPKDEAPPPRSSLLWRSLTSPSRIFHRAPSSDCDASSQCVVEATVQPHMSTSMASAEEEGSAKRKRFRVEAMCTRGSWAAAGKEVGGGEEGKPQPSSARRRSLHVPVAVKVVQWVQREHSLLFARARSGSSVDVTGKGVAAAPPLQVAVRIPRASMDPGTLPSPSPSPSPPSGPAELSSPPTPHHLPPAATGRPAAGRLAIRRMPSAARSLQSPSSSSDSHLSDVGADSP